MKYFVRFVGHVIQQPGLAMPNLVYYDVIGDFEKEDAEPDASGNNIGLKQFVNAITFQLMEHGMVVPKNPNKTQDGTKTRYDQRMGVPKHMLAYIDVIVRALEASRPVLPEMSMLEPDNQGSIYGETIN
jgi:hypothetical protein